MIAFASFVRLAFRQRALHFSGTGRYVLLDFFLGGGGWKGRRILFVPLLKIELIHL